MNREDIIRMAREVYGPHKFSGAGLLLLERFAALVAAAERKRLEATAWGASKKWIIEAVAAEREACAEICDRFQARDVGMQPAECADAIRARGNT